MSRSVRVFVVSVAAAAVLLSGCSHSQARHPSAASTAPTSSPVASTGPVTHPVSLPAASARMLESATRSGDVQSIRRAFAVPAEQRLDRGFVSGLAALTFKVDESRFRQLDDVSAQVPVTTTDAQGRSVAWTATLVLVDGGWRIALTDQVPQ